MGVMRSLPLLLLLSSSAPLACGEGGARTLVPPAAARDGARLEARYVEAEDGGARRLLHLFDRELGAACRLSARPDSQDVLHCLPAGGGLVVYLDDACTTPYVATHLEDARWVTAAGFPPFAGPARLGAQITPEGPRRFIGGGAWGCTESDVGVDGRVYEVAAFEPFDAFVQGPLVATALTEALEAHVFQGEDGSVVMHHLVDRRTGGTCRPEHTAVGPRCVGELGEVHDEGWRGADCARLAIADYGAPAVARVPERGDALYRLSAVTESDAVTRIGDDGTCAPVERFSAGRRTLYLADPYPMSEWPPLELEDEGGPELTARPGRLPGGLALEGLHLVDAQDLFEDHVRNTACGPAWVHGALACVPAPAADAYDWLTVFADARCSQPAAAFRAGATPTATFTSQAASTLAAQEDLPTARVYAVGARLRQGYARSDRGGGCAPSGYDAALYALGPELTEGWPRLRLTGAR